MGEPVGLDDVIGIQRCYPVLSAPISPQIATGSGMSCWRDYNSQPSYCIAVYVKYGWVSGRKIVSFVDQY